MGLCVSLLVKGSRKDNNTETVVGPLSHSYEAIIQNADSPLDVSSKEKLYEKLYSGVFLHHRQQKYWIDEAGRNYFTLLARGLLICWGENNEYWSWETYTEQDGAEAEMARLKRVCFFHVKGKLEIKLLSPGTKYEIVYIIMLEDDAQGWEIPISVEFRFQGEVYKRNLSLMSRPRGQWIELQFGEFHTSYDLLGDVYFSMSGNEGLEWKSGFLVKGVSIRPKT
ncbi:hypothetical protein ACHQM5_004276 [Ranunculus cassubicifolius]